MKALTIKKKIIVTIVISFICSLNICLPEEKVQKKDIKKLVKSIATTTQLYEHLSSENAHFSRDSLIPISAKGIKLSWNYESYVGYWLTEINLPKQWSHFTVWKIDYSKIVDAYPKYIAVAYDGGMYYLSGFERDQFGNLARNQIKNVPDTSTAFEVALLYLETVERVEFNSTLIRPATKNVNKDKLPTVISKDGTGYIVQLYSVNSRKESENYKVKVKMSGECELMK